MALMPLDPAVIEKSQAELREKLMSGSDVPQVNVEIVRSLMAIGRFEFPKDSGNWFGVPRVPFTEGIKLRDLYTRISLVQSEVNAGVSHAIYEDQIKQMLDICWKLCIPEKPVMRFMRRVLPWRNPFLRLAGEGDVAELLSFFMVRRMMSNVHFPFHPAMTTDQ